MFGKTNCFPVLRGEEAALMELERVSFPALAHRGLHPLLRSLPFPLGSLRDRMGIGRDWYDILSRILPAVRICSVVKQ